MNLEDPLEFCLLLNYGIWWIFFLIHKASELNHRGLGWRVGVPHSWNLDMIMKVRIFDPYDCKRSRVLTSMFAGLRPQSQRVSTWQCFNFQKSRFVLYFILSFENFWAVSFKRISRFSFWISDIYLESSSPLSISWFYS